MKQKNVKLMIFISVAMAAVFAQCKKTDTPAVEDPHNHSLLNKTLPQIQAEIAGKWQIKRTHFYVCGIAGCNTSDTTYNNNNGDLVSFLTNDTVKQTGYTGIPIKIYEKAQIAKVKVFYGGYNGFPYNVDSAFQFSMSNGFYVWAMAEIKNDSLLLVDGPYSHYLLRKP